MDDKLFKVISSTERTVSAPGGRIQRVLVVTIQTKKGGVGNVEVPVTEAEQMTDEQWQELLVNKAIFLDKPHLLIG